MTRTKLEYRVPYADTDQMQVAYYANYFVYFERLRNELIRESGITYKQVEEDGLMFPVIEAHCEYIGAARYDDLIDIYGWVEWAQGSRFQIDYEIKNGKELLVSGFTIHNCNTFEGKPRRLPDYIKKLAKSEQAP